MAHVDIDSLQKILNNLLSNALNYCRSQVTIELLQPAAGNNFILEVRNDGALVPGELSEKVFEPFYRLAHHKDKGGSGIGLALSRSLAHLHKGSIRFRSGSDMNVFVLTLPINQEEGNQ